MTVRNWQMLRLGFALTVLLSFLALHSVMGAAATSHAAAGERAVAEQAVDHGDGPEDPDGHDDCDHDDGHEHRGDEICIAPPRTGDQIVAEPVDPAVNHWSVAASLLPRVWRLGPPCPAASPRGRDLLLSVCIARR